MRWLALLLLAGCAHTAHDGFTFGVMGDTP